MTCTVHKPKIASPHIICVTLTGDAPAVQHQVEYIVMSLQPVWLSEHLKIPVELTKAPTADSKRRRFVPYSRTRQNGTRTRAPLTEQTTATCTLNLAEHQTRAPLFRWNRRGWTGTLVPFPSTSRMHSAFIYCQLVA